ncbi:MAG TPA: hypothetical protein VGO57_16225 [Verrucomicrobiae bacterium]|jgi:hypothetical protein
MNDPLDSLLEKLKTLEAELQTAMHGKEKQFNYTVQGRKVHFEKTVTQHHRTFAKKIHHYLHDARVSSFITTPAILSCIIPAALMDLWTTLYQAVCFPAYGIPKVDRRDYILLDRNKLRYLNTIERLNCAYCAYVNGLIAYVQEVAGRTEQHWCPIKHAVRLKNHHSRYAHFLDYGDAEQYRKRVEEVRRDFDDLKSRATDTPNPATDHAFQQP